MRLSLKVFIQLLLFFLVFSPVARAATRAPRTDNERSLLYWRFLCENQPQEENMKGADKNVELHCLSQNWKVVAEGDVVREVVEDAKK